MRITRIGLLLSLLACCACSVQRDPATNMSNKKFRLTPDQIKSIAPGHGYCIASDMITTGGKPVGFMYRDKPENNDDSGWRFLSGAESQQYLDDPKNLAIYDVNTIANYDPDIIPLLDAPTMTAFERDSNSGRFVKAAFPGSGK
jgi:hypothetical protein